MSWEFVFQVILLAVVVGAIIVLVTYFAARAGAFAYFRTKREHFKSVLQEMKKGD